MIYGFIIITQYFFFVAIKKGGIKLYLLLLAEGLFLLGPCFRQQKQQCQSKQDM